MQELVAYGKVRVKQHRGRETEKGEGDSADSRQDSKRDRQSGCELQSDRRNQRHARHAELVHGGSRAVEVRDQKNTLMDEEEGEQQARHKQQRIA
jgi:hypothetical protein